MSNHEKPFIYCPHCGNKLDRIVKRRKACECGFVHWDSPKPVVVCVVPMQHRWLRKAGISTRGIPDGGLLAVKRGGKPHKGRWCLPCGYMDRRGEPKEEAVREVFEETGIIVRIEKIITARNPRPRKTNIAALHYLARPVGGKLQYGDDAIDTGVFVPESMPWLCFHTHRMMRDLWYTGKLGRLTGKDLEL